MTFKTQLYKIAQNAPNMKKYSKHMVFFFFFNYISKSTILPKNRQWYSYNDILHENIRSLQEELVEGNIRIERFWFHGDN